MNNMEVISTFINLTGALNDSAFITNTNTDTNMLQSNCNIPREPPAVHEISLPYDIEEIRPMGIKAFDRLDNSTKEINEVYKTDKPYVSITDSNYAKIMLDELYNTSQYQNIPDIEINAYLENDKYFLSKENHNTKGDNTKGNNDNEILDSLKNPKKVFLDSKWLDTNQRTYNDNCLPNSSCTSPINKNGKNKDAICNVVHFGKPLEQCTNVNYSVSINQLDSISNNVLSSAEI
jgi:hypothetical protein